MTKSALGGTFTVRVDEVFKGLDAARKEVDIDTETFGCATSLETGAQYLLFVQEPRTQSKPGERLTFAITMCSPTRRAERFPDDVAWLRARARGAEMRTRIYGSVLQNYSDFSPPSHELPVAGATIKLEGPAGFRAETISSIPNGAFAFEGIAPGKYKMRAERFPWNTATDIEVDLAEAGCVSRALSLEATGTVRGIVTTQGNEPVPNVEVELVPLTGAGSGLAAHRAASATAGKQGEFLMTRVPAGDFVIAVNSTTAPSVRNPFAKIYAPGVPAFDQARRLILVPHAKVDGIVLRLPDPLPSVPVAVRLFWSDGSPVTSGARAVAYHRGRHAASVEAKDGSNEMALQLLVGLDYLIYGMWSIDDNKPDRSAVSEPAVVPPVSKEGTSTLEIQLKTNNLRPKP